MGGSIFMGGRILPYFMQYVSPSSGEASFALYPAAFLSYS